MTPGSAFAIVAAAGLLTACGRVAIETAPLRVERIASGMRFLEGPAWTAAGGYLVFSDIRADTIYRWAPGGRPRTLHSPSGTANGNLFLDDGTLITCEHDTHRVARRFPDGRDETLADQYRGQPLNSPNDLARKSDGSIWFTDPDYGLGSRSKGQVENRVYVLDPTTREMDAVATGFDEPNGLCFSPDEALLYVADSGKPHLIKAFAVGKDHTLSSERILTVIDQGAPDGIKCDSDGRLYAACADGIHILAPDGRLIKKVPIPETPANLCFGGADGRTIYVTARTSLYQVTAP